MMPPEDRQELFARVFDNPLGQAVLNYLDELYDVGIHPLSPDKEYVNVCKRSVVKQIRAFMKKHSTKE